MTSEDHIALDFESYYDQEVSIKIQGAYHYLRHPAQEIYLASIYGRDISFCGRPADAPWESLNGRLVVAHNAAFDKLVFERLQETGVIGPGIRIGAWNCTANLAAYLGIPRSLASAAKDLLGIDISKEVREGMKGRYFHNLSEAEQTATIVYGMSDAENCWKIWERWSEHWPLEEQLFSQMTIEMAHHGVYLNQAKIGFAISNLMAQMCEAVALLPWVKSEEDKPLSVKSFREECMKHGLEAPKSLAMDNEECDEWLEEYDHEYPWVSAMRTFRRTNMLMKKCESMLARVRDRDGRMVYDLKYCGAHTLRDSGAGGVNMQNLPQKELFSTDLRGCIIPGPGNEFIIADLAQIEARVLLWVVKDAEQLAEIAKGMSPYEAHARASMGWGGGKLKEEDSQRYKLAKARVLALGYGAGWRKFIQMAYQPAYLGKDAAEIFQAPVSIVDVTRFNDFLLKFEKDARTRKKWAHRTEAFERECVNSWLIVQDFRSHNFRIPRLWSLLDSQIKASAGANYTILLPSGRSLRYRDVQLTGADSCTAIICKTERWVRQKFYGGLLTENTIQAIARDVFRDAAIRIHEAGYQIVMRVHDELVIEVNKSDTAAAQRIQELMSICPDWLPGCPIGAETQTADFYKK